MADDLSLLFRIRGDSTGAKAAAADARQAITQLKNSATTDFKAIQSASTSSLGSITQTAGQISQSIPVVGRAVNTLSNAFSTLTDASTGAATGIAGMAGPLAIAVAGIVATAAAVVKLGSALFDLTQQTAEFQGKLFDLSQQTGVSVETLSALEVVARTTGGSIESITASLGIFQKNLEESLDTNSKAAQAFERLGVEVTDTEQTLRDTLRALARMPEGFRQTALALELFGRGGKQVLAILKETNGDLDGTIEKLRGMGLVTTEQARRADEFNDKLVLLEVSLRGLGTEAIPLVVDVLTDLQKAVADNKDAFEALRVGIQAVTFLFTGPLKGAIFVATGFWKSHRAEVGLLIEAYQILQTAIHGAVAEIPKQPIPVPGQEEGIRLLKELQALGAGKQFPFTFPEDLSKVPGLIKEDPKKARAAALAAAKEAEARAARDIALQQQELERTTKLNRERLERERELDLKSIEEWKNESIDAETERLGASQKLLDQERANAQKFIKNRQDRSLRLREIDLADQEAQDEFFSALIRINDEAQRRLDKSSLAIEQQLVAIRDAEREGEQNRIEAALDRKEITEREAINRRIELEKQAQADRLILIDTELKAQTTSAERKIELDNLKIESEQRFTDKTKLLIQQRNDAREAEIAKQAPQTVGTFTLPNIAAILEKAGEKAPEAEKFFRGLQSALDDLGASFGNLLGTSEDFAQQFGDVIGSAIGDLSFAIGDLVHQWVLLGETGPHAMRKLTASVLAGLAAQAAVKAIFQLAEGFAALFFNPAEAAAHFQSAALFGAVAAAAGAAGRGLAGDLFKGQGAGASGGSGGPQQLNPLTLNRNQPQTQRLIVEIRTDDSKFGQAISAHIVKDITEAGPIRETIANDGRI